MAITLKRIFDGMITEVVDRENDFHVRYKKGAYGGGIFLLPKDKIVSGTECTPAVGQAVRVETGKGNTVVKVSIAGQLVLNRLEPKI